MQTSTAELALSTAEDVMVRTEAGRRSTQLRTSYVTECHYCGFQVDEPPRVCPKCHGSTWDRFPRPGSLVARTESTPARGRVRRTTSVERGLVSLWLRRGMFPSSLLRRPRQPAGPAPTGPATDSLT